MKFIVDAHLPKSLSNWLNNMGHNSIHTLDLHDKNETQDEDINKLSVKEKRIVITKDSDFYYSFIAKREPHQLLLLKTGNISTKDLKALFAKHYSKLISSLKFYDIVEMDRNDVGVVM